VPRWLGQEHSWTSFHCHSLVLVMYVALTIRVTALFCHPLPRASTSIRNLPASLVFGHFGNRPLPRIRRVSCLHSFPVSSCSFLFHPGPWFRTGERSVWSNQRRIPNPRIRRIRLETLEVVMARAMPRDTKLEAAIQVSRRRCRFLRFECCAIRICPL
jgi:hypothetical protein